MLAVAGLAILGYIGLGFFDGTEYESSSGSNAFIQLSPYDQMVNAGFSMAYARAYDEQIAAGHTTAYSHAYATQTVNGKSERYAHAYAEQVGAGNLHWYARNYAERTDRGYSPEHARAYAEQVDAGLPPGYAETYTGLIDSGQSPAYAITFANARFVYAFIEDDARQIADKISPVPAFAPFDAAVVLAMYSSTDDIEADRRASSVRELTTYAERGDMDTTTVLGLLDDIAPEASVGERQEAARRLVGISEDLNGELTPEQSMEVANALSKLITGHGIDAEQRTEAARKMVRLSQSGELNVENASELADTTTPEWSVADRKEALGYLAWQFAHGEWDADSTKRTAEEGYTLITGGEIRIERRMEAGVDLVGEALKRYGGSGYDDESVDRSTALIKDAFGGKSERRQRIQDT